MIWKICIEQCNGEYQYYDANEIMIDGEIIDIDKVLDIDIKKEY